ncbi:hypothetical protein MKX03_036091 [Papaver bracteatum]|nr:hypothetical protein MKX03_036091 [Papaver bracteatum]
MNGKPTEFKDYGFASSAKRRAMGEHGFQSPVYQTPNAACKNNWCVDVGFRVTIRCNTARELREGGIKFLDSLGVQHLKHQNRQFPALITALPPLSLLHPHMCPEPRRSNYAACKYDISPAMWEFINHYGAIHGT